MGGSDLGSPPTRLTIKAPADLLGLVPYLLGFHPHESLVVVHIRQGRVSMTGRIDLEAMEDAEGLIEYLRALARDQDACEVILITYSADPRARELTRDVASGLGSVGLLDALLVDGRRWWSLISDEGSCPTDGTTYDIAAHPLSAEAVFAGMTALPDRSALMELVRGPGDEALPLVEAAVQAVTDELRGRDTRWQKERVALLVAHFLAHPGPLSDLERAELAVLVSSIQVRDVAWATLTRERAEDQVELWHQVVERTPTRLAAAPLCLLGMAAWVSGNGALQNCCVERMESVDPGYSLAGLLADISHRALPPSFWDAMALEFGSEPQLQAGRSRGDA